jgi:hypothetical protein
MLWKDLLGSCSYNQLFEIAQSLQAVPGRRRIARARLLEAIEAALAQPERLLALLHALSPLQRAVLQALDRSGGSLPVSEFVRRFGPLEADPARSLRSLGLIFPLGHRVELPDELRPLLHPSAPPPPTALPPGLALQRDLATFLALLARRPLALHGRWLSRRSLKSALSFLGLPGSPRRQAEAPYLAFLHDLAEGSGLARPHSGRLMITPRALHWLQASYPERARSLWEAWRTGLPRPARFLHGLSVYPWAALQSAMEEAIDRWPAGERIPWNALGASIRDGLARTTPPSVAWPEPETLEQELLLPCVWLGVLEPPSKGSTALTPLGDWFLGRSDHPPDSPHEPQAPAVFLEGDPEGLRIVGDLPLLLRFELRQWSEPLGPTADRLTPLGIAEAIARGGRPEELEDLWEQILGPQADHPFRSLLRRWVESARPYTLRVLVVFEGDPQSLPPSWRRRLDPSICPDRWVVRDLQPDRWGFPPCPGGVRIQGSGRGRAEESLSAVDAAWLWLGVELGLQLGRRYGQRLAPLRRLRDRLARAADPMALEGARALLERLSEMEEATAVPPLSSQEEARRDLLMQAIQNGRTLELIYAHPSAERPTQYRILPLRWIPRGRGRSSPMVLAIDLARGEERNFRLDRILELHEG